MRAETVQVPGRDRSGTSRKAEKRSLLLPAKGKVSFEQSAQGEAGRLNALKDRPLDIRRQKSEAGQLRR
jgi:hypothetical protein